MREICQEESGPSLFKRKDGGGWRREREGRKKGLHMRFTKLGLRSEAGARLQHLGQHHIVHGRKLKPQSWKYGCLGIEGQTALSIDMQDWELRIGVRRGLWGLGVNEQAITWPLISSDELGL